MGVYNNFIIEKGATWRQPVRWQDSAGLPINLNGYTAKLQIANKHTGDIVLNLEGQIEEQFGRIVFYLSPEDTAALPSGYFIYEIELTYMSDVYRILNGEIYISEQAVTAP